MAAPAPKAACRRLLIVDDQALFRHGLSALLGPYPEFEVVAHAGSAADAIAAVQQFRPDVVITELARLGSDGSVLIGLLKRRWPQLRIVVLTSDGSEAALHDALVKGVDGFLLKDATLDELLAALRSIVEGRRYLSPSVSGHLVDTWLNRDGRWGSTSPLERLTVRERGVLQLIAEGGSNRSVAERLQLSPKTIEKHRANLMRKLGLNNVAELLMLAVETGLVEKPGAVQRLVPARTA